MHSSVAVPAGRACRRLQATGVSGGLQHPSQPAPALRGTAAQHRHLLRVIGIQPISAGLFGVPVGFAVIIIVSLLTGQPKKETQELVEHVRYPDLKRA